MVVVVVFFVVARLFLLSSFADVVAVERPAFCRFGRVLVAVTGVDLARFEEALDSWSSASSASRLRLLAMLAEGFAAEVEVAADERCPVAADFLGGIWSL